MSIETKMTSEHPFRSVLLPVKKICTPSVNISHAHHRCDTSMSNKRKRRAENWGSLVIDYLSIALDSIKVVEQITFLSPQPCAAQAEGPHSTLT
jgi:hypothetical protein